MYTARTVYIVRENQIDILFSKFDSKNNHQKKKPTTNTYNYNKNQPTKRLLTNTVLQNQSFLIDVHCNKDEQNSSTPQQSLQNSTHADDTIADKQQHQQTIQPNTTETSFLSNDRDSTTGTIKSDADNTNNLIYTENSDIGKRIA